MTPLQKNILAACKHRPQTLRELQNALQVDNSRLRNTVTGMVATGMLSARNGTYVPGFAVMENTDAPLAFPAHWPSWRPASALRPAMTAPAISLFPAAPCMVLCRRIKSSSNCSTIPVWRAAPRVKWWR